MLYGSVTSRAFVPGHINRVQKIALELPGRFGVFKLPDTNAKKTGIFHTYYFRKHQDDPNHIDVWHEPFEDQPAQSTLICECGSTRFEYSKVRTTVDTRTYWIFDSTTGELEPKKDFDQVTRQQEETSFAVKCVSCGKVHHE